MSSNLHHSVHNHSAMNSDSLRHSYNLQYAKFESKHTISIDRNKSQT